MYSYCVPSPTTQNVLNTSRGVRLERADVSRRHFESSTVMSVVENGQ